jgi:type IV pilus assembly protein PilB
VAIPKKVLEESGFNVRAGIEAYEPVGCSRCNKAGYKGRMGIFSVMQVSDTIKEMIVNLVPEAQLAKQAAAEGMLTLREDGLAKVRTGATSIEEVVRVTS